MSRQAIEATGREGIRRMPTTIPHPPEVRGVVASLPWIAGTVAREATRRASVGRSPHQEPDEPTGGIDSSRTTRRTPEEPEVP
jgi:hypothetical protein